MNFSATLVVLPLLPTVQNKLPGQTKPGAPPEVPPKTAGTYTTVTTFTLSDVIHIDRGILAVRS